MSRLYFPQHLRCFRCAHAFHLILHREKCATLVAEALYLRVECLCGSAQFCVTLGLRFGAFDDELGEVGVISGDQFASARLAGRTRPQDLSFSNSSAIRSEIEAIASASR